MMKKRDRKIKVIPQSGILQKSEFVDKFTDFLVRFSETLLLNDEEIKVLTFDSNLRFLEHISKINDELQKESNFYFPVDFIDKDVFYIFVIEPFVLLNLEQIVNLSHSELKVKAALSISHFYLHNSPDYYILPVTPDWFELQHMFQFNKVIINSGFFLLCDAVREYEAMRLVVSELIKHEKTLSEFAISILNTFIMKDIIWQLTYKNEPLTFVFFMNIIREMSKIVPIMTIPDKTPKLLNRKIDQLRNKLSYIFRRNFDWILFDLFSRFGNDTFRNIRIASNIILALIQETFTKMRSFTL
ncbi:MAG: hypothetical protein J7L07_02560 [Candidatus Odinarchaeota archaeon]|nr:hypothetical protein [Candidatus Odinarchaeota archaeon]